MAVKKAQEPNKVINHFLEMKQKQLELEKKGNLSYASWADVWDAIKSIYPNIIKTRHENESGTLGFVDEFGGFAKVTVSILPEFGQVTTYLPIQDFRNQAIKKDKLNVNDINKAYQRATVKAIAELTGLGLYIYRGEDLPTMDVEKATVDVAKALTPEKKTVSDEMDGIIKDMPGEKLEIPNTTVVENEAADAQRLEEGKDYVRDCLFNLGQTK
jgi:hypothetical protein